MFAFWGHCDVVSCLLISHVCGAVQLRRLACLCLSVVPVLHLATIALRHHVLVAQVGPNDLAAPNAVVLVVAGPGGLALAVRVAVLFATMTDRAKMRDAHADPVRVLLRALAIGAKMTDHLVTKTMTNVDLLVRAMTRIGDPRVGLVGTTTTGVRVEMMIVDRRVGLVETTTIAVRVEMMIGDLLVRAPIRIGVRRVHEVAMTDRAGSEMTMIDRRPQRNVVHVKYVSVLVVVEQNLECQHRHNARVKSGLTRGQ